MIGRVISSSTDEVQVRVDDSVDVESLSIGSLVVIESSQNYLARVSTIESRNLGESNLADKVVTTYGKQVYSDIESALGNQFYYVFKAHVSGILGKRLSGAKSIPKFFSNVRRATQKDLPFLSEGSNDVRIGTLRDIDVPICIDSSQLITRHCGVFGKTGSGKSNTVKVLLSRFIEKRVPCLVFDIHGEYSKNDCLKGHKDVKVVGIRANEDITISLPLSAIRPIDLELVSTLNETQSEAIGAIRSKIGKEWIEYILKAGKKDIERDFGGMIFESTMLALRRKMERLANQEYVGSGFDSLTYMRDAIKRKKTIIVDFGPLEHNDYAIRLITTVISRYMMETYKNAFKKGTTYPETLIVLEEAHKLLSKDKARYTIFETIAREGRKFGLGLLIVDQMPRKIHEEIISQLNTVIIMLLSNMKDREHLTISSESNLSEFKEEMSRLDVGEMIIAGMAVPLPLSGQVPEFIPPKNPSMRDMDEFIFNE